jgi:hypothetical protein
VFDEIKQRQRGIVTRAQALAYGMSVGAIRSRLRFGHWQAVFRSTYATFSGPIPREALLWAAVLRAGPGATLSHHSAAELAGLVDDPGSPIHVTVPGNRRPQRIPGVVTHLSQRVHTARHPTRLPPQTRIEETVIDLSQSVASLEQALGWITRACGRRLTRPERIVEALADRKKVRWRDEILAALTDVATGAHSALELRYLRDVERAHGLPSGSRQHTVFRAGGRFYDDVRYAEFGIVIELDGRAAHPEEARWRDLRRDNLSVVQGRRVLRYGWADVAGRPCDVAAQVAEVLRTAGWRGAPRPCHPGCAMITKGSGTYRYPNPS